MRDCAKLGHVTKILEWKYIKVDGDVISKGSLFGCTECDATSDDYFPEVEDTKPKEPCSASCDCFKCKVQTLQMNTGDAGRDVSRKSVESRVDFYRRARADGIQPNGTHPVQVEAAYAASEKLNRAYDGGTMTRADKITKSLASTMNEVEKS